MKKVLICMLSALTMLQCATAFAGEYDRVDNNVIVDESTNKTVIIARNTGLTMTDDDIVYVGQEDEGFFGASAIFELKESPAVGFYTIMLGGDNQEATTRTFFIGTEEYLEDNFADRIKLEELEGYAIESEDGTTVTKAYVSQSTIPLQQAKSIVVKYGTQSVCTEFGTVTSGSGDVMLAVKLVGIPKDTTDVQVWISSTEISTKDLIME